MVVDHAGGLHVGIYYGRAHKLESTTLEIFAELIGFGRRSRNLCKRSETVPDGLPSNKAPHIAVEGAAFGLHGKKRLGIVDRSLYLQPISNNPGILQQALHVFAREPGNNLRVATFECNPKIFSLPENCGPAQSRLHSFQHEEFKNPAVIVQRHAPLFIMVSGHQRIAGGPGTALELLNNTSHSGKQDRAFESFCQAFPTANTDLSLSRTEQSFDLRFIGAIGHIESVIGDYCRMCLIFVAIDAHPDYRLVIAANRDEFYDRPSAPAAFWPEAPELLAGKDLRGGGTWLGITRTGRIAALTNYRHPDSKSADAPSRGRLVSDFLLGRDAPVSYLEKISADADRYNGFNILVGQNTELYHYSNRASGIRKLDPGIHGLSNHLLDTPWPKVEKGTQALKIALSGKNLLPEDLFHLLMDRTVPPDEVLPDTGVGLEMERMLSPVFISSPDYGTRSSTVILLDRKGKVTFMERSFRNGPGESSRVEHTFTLETALLATN